MNAKDYKHIYVLYGIFERYYLCELMYESLHTTFDFSDLHSIYGIEKSEELKETLERFSATESEIIADCRKIMSRKSGDGYYSIDEYLTMAKVHDDLLECVELQDVLLNVLKSIKKRKHFLTKEQKKKEKYCVDSIIKRFEKDKRVYLEFADILNAIFEFYDKY